MPFYSIRRAATDSRLTGITGTGIEMPFMDIFDPNEEVVDSSATWGDNSAGYYTSQRVTASTQYAPYCTRGFMHSMDDLSKYQTGEDALAYERTKLSAALNEKQTEKLVNQLEGVFDEAWLITAWTSEATAGSEDDSNMFSLQNVIQAQYLLVSTLSSCRPLLFTRVLQPSCSCRSNSRSLALLVCRLPATLNGVGEASCPTPP